MKYPILKVKSLIKLLFHNGNVPPTVGGKFCYKPDFVLRSSNFETISIAFRDKRNGWKHYTVCIVMKETDGQ